MISAQEARSRLQEKDKRAVAIKLSVFVVELDQAVQDSIRNNVAQTTKEVPPILQQVIPQIVSSLEGHGYKVKVEQVKGWFGDSVYRAPKVLLTLYFNR